MSKNYSNLDLPEVVTTSSHDVYKDVINPLLERTKIYRRGVAYFHVEWIILSKDSLLTFIKNGGKMKLLTSVSIENEEYEAYENGVLSKVDEVLKKEIIERLKNEYSGEKAWALDYLSYMILEEILEVKVSISRKSKISIYHDKLAFFEEDKNIVCMHGTLNDSHNATNNHESIDIFRSWVESDINRIKIHKRYFNELWNDVNPSYKTMTLPKFIEEELVRLGDERKVALLRIKKPIKPRSYQVDAINALRNNNWSGLLEMATGTGKTYTSLFAVRQLAMEKQIDYCIIVVPQTHLIDQWIESVLEVFPDIKYLICAFNKKQWGSKAFRIVNNNKQHKTPMLFITTYDTLIDETMVSVTNRMANKVYIFDECHKLGAPSFQKSLRFFGKIYKIGLSATPNRWLDDSGNNFINELIGDVVYSYNLEKAINDGKLTPYNYYVKLVELTHGDTEDFAEITKKISAKLNYTDIDDQDSSLQRMLQARANISKGSVNKLKAFLDVFRQSSEKSKSIVYVHDQQVYNMVGILRKEFNINVHGIIAETPVKQRTQILKAFNNGDIDVLVAIKCLDEGVDVKNCKYEYILASSTNPREFIQRRGRVLRLAQGKKVSYIYDFVSIANELFDVEISTKKAVVGRELARVAEFIRLCHNGSEADEELYNYLHINNLLNEYEEKDPWDIKKLIGEEIYEDDEI